MGELLKLLLCGYIFSLIVSLLIGTVRFFLDVRRWHDKEEKTIITPSDFEEDASAPADALTEEASEEEKESEVIENEHERERDTSAILHFGS